MYIVEYMRLINDNLIRKEILNNNENYLNFLIDPLISDQDP